MTFLKQSDFATRLGVSKPYVTQLKKEGRLVMSEDGKQVDVEASEARIKSTADPGHAAVAERHAAARTAQPVAVDGEKVAKTARAEMAEKVTTTYQQSRAVRERYAALTAKAEYEARIGKLVDADAARSAVADLCVTFRQHVELWPDTVGPLLVQKDQSEIRAIMQEHAEILLHAVKDEIKNLLAEPAQ